MRGGEGRDGGRGGRGEEALQKSLNRDAHLKDFGYTPKMKDVKFQSPKYNSIIFGPPK